MAGREPYASDSLVGLYRTVSLMHMETEREENFEALQRYIGSSAPRITKSAWNEILVFSQNYHTGKINQEKENFLGKIWKKYQKMIAFDVICEGENIGPELLKNYSHRGHPVKSAGSLKKSCGFLGSSGGIPYSRWRSGLQKSRPGRRAARL